MTSTSPHDGAAHGTEGTGGTEGTDDTEGTGGTEGTDEAHSHIHERLDVARLLEENLLLTAEVLRGEEGLRAPLTWCLPWDEVAGTSCRLDGVAVVARAEQLASAGGRVLRALGQRGAVAVFLDAESAERAESREQPQEALSACRLPVVRLPAGVDYAALSHLVADLALSKEAHVLRYGVTVHRTLAELLYRGAGLSALGRQLSRLSGCPVFVLDAPGRRLAYEYEGKEPAPAPDDVIRALQNIPLERIEEPQPMTGEVVRSAQIDVGGRTLTCMVNPIVLGGRHDGWIALVELDPAPRWHELARHRVVVEQAAMIIGSEMLRLRSVEVAEERARGDFVHALLHGRLTNPNELSSRAEHYGFDVTGTYGVVVARGFGLAGSPESLSKMLGLARSAAQLLPRKGSQALVTVVGDVLVVVRQTDAAGSSGQIAHFAAALSRDLARRVQREVVVSHGRPVTGAQHIVDSYREARIALGVCERLGITEVSGYGELRVYAALLDLAESQRGRTFAHEVLGPLRRANSKGGGDLEEAVLAYIEAGGNLNAAARRLAMHRNTMLYKLDRASRALGMDLRQAEHQFAVWLAHHIEMLGDVQAGVGREITPRS